VAAGRRRPTWDVTEEVAAHSAFPLPPFGHGPRYSASHQPPLRPPSPITDEPPLSCPTGPKGVPCHYAPPAPRACPQRRLAMGHGISPAVVFLRELLADGSLLRLFPHPIDPAASSVPPRSSSPTTSPAASTTPSAPHRRLLPVGTHTAA
jgi:hypothetical protein